MTGVQSTARACALPNTPLAHAAYGLELCVHCGFCLPACPTYLALHDANASPRGRLVLMQRLLDGELAPTDRTVATHFDQCLGCRGCETACPSGVPYGHLLEATRATLRDAHPPPRIARLILALFTHRSALSVVLALARALRATRVLPVLARALPRRVGFPLAMLASTAPLPRARSAPVTPDADHPTVVLLEGCVMRGLFSHVHDATRRTLHAAGHQVGSCSEQHCCGALHAHAGDLASARRLAQRNIAAFEQHPDASIAVNAAGCGAMLKQYAELFGDDAHWQRRARRVAERVRDVSELLVRDASDRAEYTLRPIGSLTTPDLPYRTASAPCTVSYDAPCHLQHGQRVSVQPEALLRAIPDIVMVPLTDSDQCCGSAGIYNLLEPAVSDAVLAPKLTHIAETACELVATGNPGCHMQIGAGLLLAESTTRVMHPVELLDRALP